MYKRQYIYRYNTVIVDLRSREEFAEEHIVGAYNIPFEEFDENSFPFPINVTVILYCERGSSSLMAAKQLSRKGYFDVKTVIGGILSYRGEYLERKQRGFH